MNTFDHESVINEVKLHEIARIIDNEFFTESIKEQIYDGLDSTTTDYLDQFNIKLRYVMENYDEIDYGSAVDARDELYRNIIEWVNDKYDIEITYDEDELLNIATQIYSFFVLDLKEACLAFLTSFIQNNYQDIVNTIDESELNKSQVNPDDDKDMQMKVTILTNLGRVVEHVVEMNIEFTEFIKYAAMPGDIRSVVELHNGEHLLSISNIDNMIKVVITELKENVFDHNIVVSLAELLISSFNISKGDVSNHG